MGNEVFQVDAEHPHYLSLQPWQKFDSWLIAGFTTRMGGYSTAPFDSFNQGLHVGDVSTTVLSNRSKLSTTFNLPAQRIVCGEQSHGTHIQYVTEQDAGRGYDAVQTALQQTDGLYTDCPGLLLMSFYADCVPLYFLQPDRKLIGLAHAGWKGTVGRIGTKMVRHWAEKFACSSAEMYVAIGPSIGQCCYEVDQPVAALFLERADLSSPLRIQMNAQGKYMLDLAGLNYDLLIQAGIPSSQIVMSERCTACQTDLFYSYRQEAGQTGRMASYMAIREGGN